MNPTNEDLEIGAGGFSREAPASGLGTVPAQLVEYGATPAPQDIRPTHTLTAERNVLASIRVCAITCDGYPQDPLVRRTAEAGAGAGVEYHVICSTKKGQAKYELFNGVRVHRIPMSRISARPLGTTLALWFVFAVAACVKVARLHRKFHFDVVHVHNLPDFLVFAALVPKLCGARVILHVQDVAPELMGAKTKGLFRRITVPLAKLQERISTAFADHVLTVGWPFEECLLKRGVSRWKLSSILNSADPNLFPVEKRSEPFLGDAIAQRPIVLMYYGTCSKRQGLDTAIRALAKAQETAPHLRLHIKGSGDHLPHLKELAQSLSLADRVAFYPGGPIDEVADFVAQGDISIIPYRADGFMDLVLPTKAYECALMRRPMIASDTVAMRSMFRATSVMLCDPSSVDSFAEAIAKLYHSPEKRARLISSAEQDYTNYRWEKMAGRYTRLIAALAAENGQKARPLQGDSGSGLRRG